MSEEILQAAGDTAFWRRKAEQAEALARTLQTQRDAVEQNAADLRAALAQAEADAAALRAAIWSAHFDIHYRHKDHWVWKECPKPTCYPLREALATGAGIKLLAELEAAREIVEAVRGDVDVSQWLEEEIDAYDAAVNSRTDRKGTQHGRDDDHH